MTETEGEAEIHATCVVLDGAGILLRGEPGAGKSDLALRLVAGGARLVSDDRVRLARDGADVVARAPDALAGLIEVRGVGIVRLPADRVAARGILRLVCDLVPADAVERLPEPARTTLVGVAVPLVRLDSFAASTPVKLRLAAGLGPGSIIVGA